MFRLELCSCKTFTSVLDLAETKLICMVSSFVSVTETKLITHTMLSVLLFGKLKGEITLLEYH